MNDSIRIVNMTPHAVILLDPACAEYNSRTRSYSLTGDRKVVRELPSEGVVRCAQSEKDCEPLDGIPTVEMAYGALEGLPEEAEGTFYVVSALAASAGRAAGRRDLLIPSRMVRDDGGNIVGCLALGR